MGFGGVAGVIILLRSPPLGPVLPLLAHDDIIPVEAVVAAMMMKEADLGDGTLGQDKEALL